MKLALNQLQVDSYAAQANETELTQVKGGSTKACETVYYVNVISPYVAAAQVAMFTGVVVPPMTDVSSAPMGGEALLTGIPPK